jgi:putative sigma-54 modulation protein
MQLTVTGRQIDVTDSLREYAKNKLARLERHFDQAVDVHMILSVEKLAQRAEATLNAKGKTLHADAEGQDAYAAIDGLIDKLDRQIKKFKEKITNHHRGEAGKTLEV